MRGDGGPGVERLAVDAASMADTVTKWAIAALTLVAALLVVAGLVRAWSRRRRPQVVLEDIGPLEGAEAQALGGFSPQFRQAVAETLRREGRDAWYSVLETLDRDIRHGLLKVEGQTRMNSLTAGLRSGTEDSLDSLISGVRAMAPKEAEGFLTAVGVALPAQRGWIVRTHPVRRGSGTDGEIGLTLEFGPLGHPADSVTTFWVRVEGDQQQLTEDARTECLRAAARRLVDPAALWVATRLVARQLAVSGVPAWRRLIGSRRRRDVLTGLQWQLAGQLSLYAITNQPAFGRGFAEQALRDLAEAQDRLPGYFRPHLATGNVRERLAWSYRRAGDSEAAAREFTSAVADYGQGIAALTAVPDADPGERSSALERLTVRQTKSQLLSGDAAYVKVAGDTLASLDPTAATTALPLYNAACLFAVAAATPALAEAQRVDYCHRAWILLGRSLLLVGREGPWRHVLVDVELEPLGREQLKRFCRELKQVHPRLTPLDGDDALRVINAALTVLHHERTPAPLA